MLFFLRTLGMIGAAAALGSSAVPSRRWQALRAASAEAPPDAGLEMGEWNPADYSDEQMLIDAQAELKGVPRQRLSSLAFARAQQARGRAESKRADRRRSRPATAASSGASRARSRCSRRPSSYRACST